MPNYSKSKVYAIRSPNTDQIYIGSTTQSLSMRMADYRRCYKRYLKTGNKRYDCFDILDKLNPYIELIQDVDCKNKIELKKVEIKIIKSNPKSLKSVNETKCDINVKTVCPCGGKYTYSNKSKHCRTKRHKLYLSS